MLHPVLTLGAHLFDLGFLITLDCLLSVAVCVECELPHSLIDMSSPRGGCSSTASGSITACYDSGFCVVYPEIYALTVAMRATSETRSEKRMSRWRWRGAALCNSDVLTNSVTS